MEAIVMVLGVVTWLSVMDNKLLLVTSILVIGLSDAFANAAAFHVSEETETKHSKKEIIRSTLFCFGGTFLTFGVLVLPLLLLPFGLRTLIIITWVFAIVLIVLLADFIARLNKQKRVKLITEYVLLGVVVSVLCYFLAELVKRIVV
ncbi:hypothetical protein CMO89_04025 [Candidatus Woesearchaeota archaeon]|nr:hypothetical protein [Candidatus Woesearchaeota archaeon]